MPADLQRTPEQRIVEAAAVLRAAEAVTGWAALRWMGSHWFDGTSDGVTPRAVPLVARRHLIPPAGAAVSQEFLHPDEMEVVDGLPVTVPLRSVTYEMRYAPSRGAAIVALDMACFADLVSLAEVAAYLASLGPVTGIQQARDALVEGEENSWSPRETGMRGLWVTRGGLPRPRCNAPVFTLDGHHVGTPDVIDPELGLLAQYHGAGHLSLAGSEADVRKDAAYRDVGLETVTMLASDWVDPSGFINRLQAAARRARATTAPRLWTVELPPWWTPTHTVAHRRALGERERERYLRYRHAA